MSFASPVLVSISEDFIPKRMEGRIRAIYIGTIRLGFVSLVNSELTEMSYGTKILDILRKIIYLVQHPDNNSELIEKRDDEGISYQYMDTHFFFMSKEHWDASVEKIDELSIVTLKIEPSSL